MHRLPAVTRGVLASALVFALLFTGCDKSSAPTVAPTADKPDVSAKMTSEAPANTPGATELPGNERSEPIPGQYIVVLKDNAVTQKSEAGVRALAQEMLGKSGAVKNTYATALTGFAAKGINETIASRLADDPRVKYVEQDRTVYAVATQSNATWGLDRIDARSGLDGDYTYNASGQGVNVYVLDTGINTSHNDFGGRAVPAFDAIGDGQQAQDCNGHGTHVAGTIGGGTYGVAKNATLYAVRVLDCSGGGTLSGVVDGIDWVTQNYQAPAVANMSLGGGASQSIDDAVANSVAAGVTYAVAAGNENTDACTKSPARVSSAITVGSSTSSDSRSSFSNYGSCVDLFAPGSNITSAWYTSDTATNTISGTSMASPHVAGVAALYLENNPSASPSAVTNAIESSATQGVVSDAQGSPNLMLYSLFDGSTGGGGGNDGGSGGGGTAPCTNCSAFSGSLSGSGDSDYQPDGTYYAGDGTETGYLVGPSSADYDLYLYKWSGYGWQQVASSTSASSEEQIDYNGSSGYYYWEVYSYSGSGSYTFYLE